MAQLFKNNAVSTLASGILSGATSLTVATGQGALFPTLTPGNYFYVTLYQRSGNAEINHEIVKVTARSGDVMTITRAQEGTTARAFNASDPVELRLTTAFMNSAVMYGYTGLNVASPIAVLDIAQAAGDQDYTLLRLNVAGSEGFNVYGAMIVSSGTCDSFTGLHIGTATGTATGTGSNYQIYLVGVGAASDNFALLSISAAQSSFAGSLGVGVYQPTYKLDVSGATGVQARFKSPAQGTAQIQSYTDTAEFTSPDANVIYGTNGAGKVATIYANASPVAYITSTGLGVGVSPSYKLQVRGSGSNERIVLESGSGTDTLALISTGSAGYLSSEGTGDIILRASASTNHVTITTDGRVYGAALHNNAGAVTGTTNQYIASGTYNNGSAAANLSNLTSVSTPAVNWIRVGNVVTVSGVLQVDPIATGICGFDLALPIGTTISAYENLGGAGAVSTGAALDPVYIGGNNANNKAAFSWYASNTNARYMSFSFTYLVA